MSLSFRRKTRKEEGHFRDLSRIRRRAYLVKIAAFETSTDGIVDTEGYWVKHSRAYGVTAFVAI